MADTTFEHAISLRLREFAMSLPEASEGDSCVNRAFRVGKKAYFYLGEKPAHIYAMLKLTDSYAAAAELNDPRVAAGKHGWVTLRFQPDDHPDADAIERWIIESYRALMPKRVVALLG